MPRLPIVQPHAPGRYQAQPDGARAGSDAGGSGSLMASMSSFDSSTPPLAPPPDPAFPPISLFDPVPFIDNIFRQTAHRAISLDIWLIVGRVVLALWPRNFDFAIYLLPAALGCLAVALPAAFLSLTVARHRRQ